MIPFAVLDLSPILGGSDAAQSFLASILLSGILATCYLMKFKKFQVSDLSRGWNIHVSFW